MMEQPDGIDIEARTWRGDRSVLGTWNPPEVIAENHVLSFEDRIRRMIELSNAALKFGRSRPVSRDER